MKYRVFLILLWVGIGCGQTPSSKETAFLHDNWEFVQKGRDNWHSASVPGVVHTDLLAHAMIPHPWIGTNEDSVQWIENEDWIYRTKFDLTQNLYNREVIDLVFEGLDTFAEVFINDSLVLTANNMFREWRIDMKPFVHIGTNNLKIIFTSPINTLAPYVQNMDYKLPASSESVPIKVSPYIRKAPYHFGWDWGPRLVTLGIWRPIYLEFWDKARIESIQIVQNALSDSLAQLSGNVEIFSTSEETVLVSVMGVEQQFSVNPGLNNISINFNISNPKRWWPNGWGEPNLYMVPVKLSINNNIIDQKTERIGLRTIELIHEKDSIGKSFYFKVNGEPIFAKGANYIPQSHFLPDVKEESYRKLIEDVKSANMNMLRIWGGGVYESDLFYQLCDENGILVWQDFMFANTMYPDDSAFLKNVTAEVKDNVKRLRNHTSIAHWNGNNEIDVAWHNWDWQDQFNYSVEDSTRLWQGYLKLFHQLIPEKLAELDPQRSYTTTSPLSNWGTPTNFDNSSMHYWGVWHGQDEFEDYRHNVGRFMSEYGFQSFPNMETIKVFADSTQWHIDSKVMEHHQKSYVGIDMVSRHLENHFDKPDGFKDFVMKSQQAQALAMKIAIDAHRLNKGHCWGSLYWQLNDCWPGPSWSSRDVYGRKKLFHEDLPMLFAPIALIPEKNGGLLRISLVNDLPRSVKLDVAFSLKDKNNRILQQNKQSIAPTKNDIHSLWEIPLDKEHTLLNLKITDVNGAVIFERQESL